MPEIGLVFVEEDFQRGSDDDFCSNWEVRLSSDIIP